MGTDDCYAICAQFFGPLGDNHQRWVAYSHNEWPFVRALLTELAETILVTRDNAAFPAWRPIETAPKDGTLFLGTNERSGACCVTWFGKTSHVPLYGWCEGVDGEDIDLWWPTHWMPLPPPASAARDKEVSHG